MIGLPVSNHRTTTAQRDNPKPPAGPLRVSVTSIVIGLFANPIDQRQTPFTPPVDLPDHTRQRIESLLRFRATKEQSSLFEQIRQHVMSSPDPLAAPAVRAEVEKLLGQPSALDPQKNTDQLIQEIIDSPVPSAPKIRPVSSRLRRDLQNAPPSQDTGNASLRKFADTLVDKADAELAINTAYTLINALLNDKELALKGTQYTVHVEPDSTFGLALAELDDALRSEPFKSFAQTHDIDIESLVIDPAGRLLLQQEDHDIDISQYGKDSFSKATSAVFKAVTKVAGSSREPFRFFGRDRAFPELITNFYGMPLPHDYSRNYNEDTLFNIGQLIREGTFPSLRHSDPLYEQQYAPVKQRQQQAKQQIVDLPAEQLDQRLARYAPLTAAQRVQEADEALAWQCSETLLKQLPALNGGNDNTPPMLNEVPEYSTFNQVRQQLLNAFTSTTFTDFAQKQGLDPKTARINPDTGTLTANVKGVEITFTLNDVSEKSEEWSNVWLKIKQAVQQMAAGSHANVHYPAPPTATLNEVMRFYNEQMPPQPDTRQPDWKEHQLNTLLNRGLALVQNQTFSALVDTSLNDPQSVAVRQNQQAVTQMLASTPLSPSPLEKLAAAIKASRAALVEAEDTPEDLLARAEGELATTVHRAMLELKLAPEQAASKIIQLIPPNSLFGQWRAYLHKALNSQGFKAWAHEQKVDLASLRYDPTDNALVSKVGAQEQRFTATAFAQKYPNYFDALAPVLTAAQAFANQTQPIALLHAESNGAPYQWVANFYSLSDTPGSTRFDQQAALMGRTQQFPNPPDNPENIVGWLARQNTAVGDSNDRYRLIQALENWTPDSGSRRLVVDPDSSHQPKGVTTVAEFISHNNWYPVSSKADNDNLLKALQTRAPHSPPLGNRWGFLSTPLPLNAAQRDELVEEAKKRIGTNNTLLNYLSSRVTNLSTDPEQALEQLLTCSDALELATDLQTRIKVAVTSTSLRKLLLTYLILEVDPTAGTQHKTIAGADLTDNDNVGRSTHLRRERFTQHLIENKGIPRHLAPAVAHLLLQGAAPQLLVKDVPKQVTLGSPEDVEFTTAVNRIEWTAPGATANMTYPEIMSLHNIRPISALEAQIYSYAQMNPLLDWAAIHNNVDKNNYTLEQLKDSQQKLQAATQATAEAVQWLRTVEAPNRRDMALKVLREQFGSHIDYEKRFMIENELAGLISGRHYSLAEIYEAGRLDESWGQEGNHVDFDSLRKKAGEPGFPVINDEFDKAIKADFNLRRRHTTTLFENMLNKLPVEERKSLLYGDVEFLNVEGAGSGMVITSIYNGARRDFAVYPTWGQIVRIADIDPDTPLGQKVSLEIDAEAFKTGTEPKSGVKSEVVLRATDQRLLDDNNEPWPLPVSFPAHQENDAFSPHYVAGRLSKLAKVMVDSTYLYKSDFVDLHRNWSSNTLETATQPRDFFKAIWHSLPGTSSLEDLYHGQFLKAGVDLGIDVAILVATEGASNLWGLAKSAASWAAAKVSAGFIEKFGVKEVEAIELKDFTAATTTQSIRSLSRLQDGQLTEQTADMANGSVWLSGAQDRANITAIRQGNEWYAYDAKTMAAYGPALEGFVSDTSSVLKQETFSDGTKALVTEKPLAADAYTVTRTHGFDLINEGKVYRYDSRQPGLLRDLESADHYTPLESFEAWCPAPSIGGRVKRGANDVCFTKFIEEVSGELKQELQALEHVRLFPSAPKFLRKGQFVIFERRRWKMVDGERGPKLHPVPGTKPIVYKSKITGTLKNEPEFGFFSAQHSEGLERETRVVKLNRITDAVDDKRELRGVIVNDKAHGSTAKYLVIEADTAEFYYARLEETPGSQLTFNKCTRRELPMVRAYRNKFSIRQGAANLPFDANFIALPKLKFAFEDLERTGYLKEDIDELKAMCKNLTDEQQREVVYQLQRAKAIDKADIALQPNQVTALDHPANFTSWTAEQQNKFYAQQAQDSVNRSMKATGLGPANQMHSKADLARTEAADMTINWLRNTVPPGALNHPNLIVKSGAGNCGEMALLSENIIEKSGGKAQTWYVEGGDHVFTVVGGPASGGKATIDFSQSEWKDAWIVDPWAEISCRASEYTESVKKKMAEWDAKGLKIHTRGQWRKPVDPQWIKELTTHEKRAY
ncbi:hypothetical protein SAMN03159512_05312 [Pseudomonas sp. NFR09]|uniref:hypothetical protein n=1 Tax=Pseudomonas sp. NFR09 TaxID=1566249 RepID=UPI0008CA1FBB|nr:hypothetical protein [Pseudomonas sp. NFR09]SEU13194.1 hypothetical protein SAMN03159512_05312 [Pseudomonas sp. NFR09]